MSAGVGVPVLAGGMGVSEERLDGLKMVRVRCERFRLFCACGVYNLFDSHSGQ